MELLLFFGLVTLVVGYLAYKERVNCKRGYNMSPSANQKDITDREHNETKQNNQLDK